MKPFVSVIVPAHNEEGYIGSCLRSLVGQNIKLSLFEIIVIDNASDDKTAEIAKKSGARVVSEKKKGYVYSLRKGVDEARAEIVAFIDADCIAPKNWLTGIIKNFREDPALDALGGDFIYWDSPFPFKNWRHTKALLGGGNMAIKKESIFKAGNFDPEINLGADVLISLKISSFGKMKIDHSNYVLTSARRYKEKPSQIFIYGVNSLFLVLFGKGIFRNFQDVRYVKPSYHLSFLTKFSFAFLSTLFFLTVVFPSIAHSQTHFHKKWRGEGKAIALTFDDGPDPIVTPEILATLKNENVRATFFLVGKRVREYPTLARSIVEDGNIVGNHSYYHRIYSGLETRGGIKNDFLLAEGEIRRETGEKPRLVRTPHGYASYWFLKTMEKNGFKIVDWDDAGRDWDAKTTQSQIVKRIVKAARPGSIILLHDGLEFKIGTQKKVAQALPEIIKELKGKGYKFVTVDELLKTNPYFAN